MSTVRHTYRHDVDAVFSKLTDEAFLRQRAEAAGHRNIVITIEEKSGALEVRVERDVDADVPSFAKKFVTPSNHVVDTVRWRDADNGKKGVKDVIVNSRIRIDAEITLRPKNGGCEYAHDHTPKVDVPLIGGRIGKIVDKETSTAVAVDCRLLERALDAP